VQISIFAVPASGDEAAADALNQFLSAHRIIAVDRQLVANGANSYWSLCVSYIVGATNHAAHAQTARRVGAKIDYRETLPAEAFAVYAQLRVLRKELAERDGIPVYAVFTNEQLGAIFERRITTQTALREIAGIGQARGEKYGAVVMALMARLFAEPPAVHADET
jgi:superfamily II DNA helicase RecQ